MLMAQRTVVTLIDDLDDSEADQTVEFGLDGVTYEIDLSEKNASGLRDALADYVAHARRTAGRRGGARRSTRTASAPATRASGSTSADREQNKAIREWARTQGYEVSERGRIPSSVTEAYRKDR
jgi:hypothetical protein